MKALTLTDVEKFEIIEKDIPKVKKGQVLIEVSKCGICGSDIHMIWHTGYNAGKNAVIGHEFCGTVVDAGDSTILKNGDRVAAIEMDSCLNCDYCNHDKPELCDHVLENGPGIGTDGGYGQYVLMRDDMAIKLPDGISDISAALVEPFSVSYHGAKQAKVSGGKTVLITGCGPIGLFAAAASYALEASKIVILEANPERIKLAEESHFVTYALNSLDANINKKLTEIEPDGFDAVIECSGNKNASTLALNNLKKGGHMSIIAYGDAPEIDIFNLVNKERHIDGSLFFTVNEFKEAIELMASKKINLEKYVKLIKMEEVQETLEKMKRHEENQIKYMIDYKAMK